MLCCPKCSNQMTAGASQGSRNACDTCSRSCLPNDIAFGCGPCNLNVCKFCEFRRWDLKFALFLAVHQGDALSTYHSRPDVATTLYLNQQDARVYWAYQECYQTEEYKRTLQARGV